MSFLAKLKLGSEYNILTVEYDIMQMMDHDHRPSDLPKGGLIQVTIESSNSNELFEWMVHPTMLKNGRIDFYRRDANSSMKTIEFTDAFCVYLKEVFNAEGKTPMVTKLTISARELKVKNLTISNPWPGMKSSSTPASQQISTYSVD